MTTDTFKQRRSMGLRMARLAGSCLALAPLAPALLANAGWSASLGAGLPLMLVAALFGYGY
ncbi:MAG: hypothetical protein V4723_13615 [Pseudomonadota bacterium]